MRKIKNLLFLPSDWYYWKYRQPKLRERMRRSGNDNPQIGIGDDAAWALAERLKNTDHENRWYSGTRTYFYFGTFRDSKIKRFFKNLYFIWKNN